MSNNAIQEDVLEELEELDAEEVVLSPRETAMQAIVDGRRQALIEEGTELEPGEEDRQRVEVDGVEAESEQRAAEDADHQAPTMDHVGQDQRETHISAGSHVGNASAGHVVLRYVHAAGEQSRPHQNGHNLRKAQAQ